MAQPNGDSSTATTSAEGKPVNEMTSKDYYFDSYAHFGIHEVSICSFVSFLSKRILTFVFIRMSFPFTYRMKKSNALNIFRYCLHTLVY